MLAEELDDLIKRKIEISLGTGAEKLDLAGLNLSAVPNNVRDLPRLRILNLANNNLSEIPEWIAELTALEYLYLVSNPLRGLPPSIAKLAALKALTLDGSSADVAIDAIGQLHNLQTLALSNLGLRSVPNWMRALKKLRILRLHGNPLEKLPHWIGELTELTYLSLAYTELRAVPTSLRNLRKLERLELKGNLNLGLLPEILNRGPTHILDYYFRTTDPAARQPLNEFKLVLVGRGGVGKTTLVHKLITDQFETFRRTAGVQITKWQMEIDGELVRAHIWDFGGQEIMHGTHRFFMTERALYLILLTGREGTEDHDAEYWLSLVRSFAGNVPVIVLLHKWNDYSFELNRALLRQKYGQIVFLTTDSETAHGIAGLREQITNLALGLPGLKASWPVAWQRVKDDLPLEKDSWLTFDAFRAFCSERGVELLGDQEALAGYLHDLGLML